MAYSGVGDGEEVNDEELLPLGLRSSVNGARGSHGFRHLSELSPELLQFPESTKRPRDGLGSR